MMQPAKAFLEDALPDFGFWFNDRVVLMVREGMCYAAPREGQPPLALNHPLWDIDDLLESTHVAPDELGEAY